MKKNIIIVSVIAVAIIGFAVFAQGGKFYKFYNSPTVYKAYSSAEEFLADGGDWNAIENFDQPFGGASGFAAALKTATSTQVGPQQNKQVFAKKPSCSSRVISTKESNIMITLGDANPYNISSTTLSGSVGFWQAASTTIAYDSEIYGCGRWFGYSYSSSTITTAEF